VNTEQILRQTFSAHEHLSPDAESALDGIKHRVRTRHRSRIAIAGAVAAVVAVAVGASLLAGTERQAGHGPTRSAPPARQPHIAAPHPVAAPDHVTIAAGWLPAGEVAQVELDNSFGHQLRGYTVTSGQDSVYVLIGIAPGSVLPTDYKRGTPHDLTISARPAREWSVDDWYYLAFVAPGGRIATVDIEGGKNQGKGGDGSAAALAAIGRNVAAHLDLNRHDPIRTGFALSYLPAGLVVQAVSGKGQNDAGYTLAPATARWQDQMPTYATVTKVSQAWRNLARQRPHVDKPAPPTTAGRPVQGHRTYVVTGGDTPVLWIDEIQPGVSIEISGGPGVASLAEVYRIADGLILPH
jgi:hypothetical protein